MSEKHFGKYRGIVVNNIDPMNMGRIQAKVPDISGDAVIGWAMPSVQPNGPKRIGCLLPKLGAAVWIEFEQGDLNSPIWCGCFFANANETPPSLRHTK